MSKFSFVSHESFPEDEYTKEIVYFDMHVPVRVAWVRKSAKTGGLFWDEASIGVTKNGKKEYSKTWMQDSNFLQKDMKEYLEHRKWTNQINVHAEPIHQPYSPKSMDEVDQERVPF